MHPVHDMQETTLNMRGGGIAKTSEDRIFLKIQTNCTNEHSAYLRMGGGGCKHTHHSS